LVQQNGGDYKLFGGRKIDKFVCGRSGPPETLSEEKTNYYLIGGKGHPSRRKTFYDRGRIWEEGCSKGSNYGLSGGGGTLIPTVEQEKEW